MTAVRFSFVLVLALATAWSGEPAPADPAKKPEMPAKPGDPAPKPGDPAPKPGAPMPKPGAKKEPVKDVPPEVEEALTKSGWTNITGTWKKKAANAYEVTDGKVEAAIVNGALQATVYAGDKGSVKVMVRDTAPPDDGQEYRKVDSAGRVTSKHLVGSGYGVKLEGRSLKVYGPFDSRAWLNVKEPVFRPCAEREIKLPGIPKYQTLVTVNKGHLEIYVNGERKKLVDAKLAEEGVFIVEVTGTAIIEAPMVKGK